MGAIRAYLDVPHRDDQYDHPLYLIEKYNQSKWN